MLTKEQIALRKQAIVRGAYILCDCDITTPFAVPRTGSPLDEAARHMEKARQLAEQLGEALRREKILMVISGIACTPHAALQGYVLLAGAVDVTQRGIPLCLEHGREIGEITGLMYSGPDLFVTAETDDEAASQLNYFSIAGRPLEREQHGAVWRVSKFRCTEISLVRVPQNDRCLVLARKPSDPMRSLHKTRMRELDLYARAFTLLAHGLKGLAALRNDAARFDFVVHRCILAAAERAFEPSAMIG